MTNFQRDLIRYLETTEGRDYSTVAEDFFFGEAQYWTADWREKPSVPEGWENMNISFELMDNYGGEGRGDDYWSVYKFTDNATGEEVYLKFSGWYASYNGAEYTDLFIVQPKEKTVVVYE